MVFNFTAKLIERSMLNILTEPCGYSNVIHALQKCDLLHHFIYICISKSIVQDSLNNTTDQFVCLPRYI